jgi:hypothetical protein
MLNILTDLGGISKVETIRVCLKIQMGSVFG